MWRLPFLNLCFVVCLITLVAVQHSVSVFRPTESSDVLIAYDAFPARSSDGFDSLWKTIPFRYGLGRPIGYLSDLWRRSIILREWMLEYETSYWGTIRAGSGAEADLVEARFHVANAEVLDVAMGEKRRAEVELRRAENYLLETWPSILDELLPAREKIRQKLDAARVDSETTISENSELYERIKSDLDHMIERLRFTKA